MPQRFLRPGITNSERWNSVPFDTQSLFIRLLTTVDDFGRCDGRTAVIASCFAVWNETNPGDRRNLQQIERMLQQLSAASLIERYESCGKRVLQVTQWQERVRQGVKERWPCSNLQQKDSDLLPSSPLTLASTPSPRNNGHSPIIPVILLQVSGFEDEWRHFVDHRKAIRKPMTPHAQELILCKLATRPNQATQGVKMAIEKGWRGFEWSWFDESANGRRSAPAKPQRKFIDVTNQ